MFSKIILSLAFLLGLIASALAAGELGIARDTSLADARAYNSKCTFKTQPGDAEFLAMVNAAWKEMDDTETSKTQKANLPSAMIGLSIGNEVYFASSIRSKSRQIVYEKATWQGGDGTINPPLPQRFKAVTDALESCTDENRKQHGNQASCGEIMSTILWMADHPNENPGDHKPKVAAYNKNGYLFPCSSEPDAVKWGCAQWIQKMGLKVVEKIDNLPSDFAKPEKVDPLDLEKCLTVEVQKDTADQSQKRHIPVDDYEAKIFG